LCPCTSIHVPAFILVVVLLSIPVRKDLVSFVTAGEAAADTMTPAAAARYVELLLEDESTGAGLLDDPDVVNTLFEALREAVQTALQGERRQLTCDCFFTFSSFNVSVRCPVTF
jgi:hypothetical protein